jgi:hypothetical protein
MDVTLILDPPPSAPSSGPPPLSEGVARVVADLEARAAFFARTPPRDKARLLRAAIPRILALAPEMVAAACSAAGVDPASPLAGPAWLAGPVAILAAVRRFAEALEDVAESGRPPLALDHLRGRLDGRTVAHLEPSGPAERRSQREAEATAVFDEGVVPEDIIAGQAAFYRQPDPPGIVALVHVAGGPPAAGPILALEALFARGQVAVLMTTPATAHLGSIVERMLAPVGESGFLRVVAGGEGPPPRHPGPVLTIAAGEGGGPVLVVPAFYARDELAFVTRRLAAEVAAGTLFRVDAPRAIVLSGCWAQRGLFVDHLERALAALPPGCSRSLVPGAEPVPGVLSLIEAGCDDPAEMLAAAVDRCNQWGRTSTAELVVHHLHEEVPEIAAAVDGAAVRLRCGVLGIDQWPALVTFRGDAPTGPWMLAKVDKAIVRGPLRQARRPVYFPDPGAVRRCSRLAAFQAAPGLLGLARGARV